ncbi:protein quiver-like isoform X1 [Pecten maximus]|uniref:protein quiver-like isoform X1 n=1 Tax=Pecten maximus TaxID=6579 RepID=UPI0014584C2A|nr:protein quiver-like isoform X1 [Pecten maximus]
MARDVTSPIPLRLTRHWIVLLVCCLHGVRSQSDLSGPILCYHCVGVENNSSCSDPFDEKTNTAATKEECIHGVCVKWTRYINNVRMLERTCSARMTLNIMKIDGVCRTESDGNGYLCMCGKHLCNGTASPSISLLSAVLCALISFRQWLPWFR